MTKRSAEATVHVRVDPDVAFSAFTAEIGQWWVPGPINFWDAARCTGRAIEPGVGGRVLELYGAADPLVLGVITGWEPGVRFAYDSAVDETEVEVTFAAADGGTTVRVVQRLRSGADESKPAFFFWPNVIRWYRSWTAERDADPDRHRTVARLGVALTYDDPGAAARWLHEVFGLTSWDGIPAEGETRSWVELHVGNVGVLLFPPADQPDTSQGGSARQRIWVYVDDVDAHLEHTKATGATVVSGMEDHGYRSYTAADPGGHLWTFVQSGPWVAAG